MRNTPWLGYTLYGIVVTVFFAYWLFPSALLERSLERAASRWYGVDVSVESPEMTLLPGVRMAEGRVALPGRPDITITARDIVVRPKLSDLVRGKISLTYHCRSYGGQVEGSASFSNRFALSGPMNARVVVSGVNLGQARWLEILLGRRIEGTLRGFVTLGDVSPALTDGTGNLELYLERGSFELTETFMGFDRIDFDRVEMRADLAASILTVRTMLLESADMAGSINGTVNLRSHLPNSRIAFRGSASLPSLGSTLPLTLGGTLGNPRVRAGRS